MPMRLSMNIGFTTNSSFAVCHFPRQLLDHPTVKEFIELFEVSQGFIGDDMWNRSTCSTMAVTRKQKERLVEAFHVEGEDAQWVKPPAIDVESDDVTVIYGDEYTSLARNLAGLMREAAKEMGLSFFTDEYH